MEMGEIWNRDQKSEDELSEKRVQPEARLDIR
jgi:hypothetical protein